MLTCVLQRSKLCNTKFENIVTVALLYDSCGGSNQSSWANHSNYIIKYILSEAAWLFAANTFRKTMRVII